MNLKGLVLKACTAAAFGLFSLQATAITTGLDFVGGCPESGNGTTSLCDMGSNADVDNVAAILGVDVSLVTQVFTGYDVTNVDNDMFNGDWSVSDPSITHLAFKSDGYFILAEVNDTSGTWDNFDWDIVGICPDTICTGGPRPYTNDDFTNNGGNIAALSNVRAFTVVPVPAAVWLFGSGLLGLVGIARRRRA